MPYDVNIQLVAEEDYTGMAFYSFGQKRSLGIRGLGKLVNIFAKHLLTPVGSDPIDPNYGTNLTTLIGSNVTLRDAREVLNEAVNKTTQAIQGWQASRLSTPDDERLASASVTDYIEIAGGPGFAAQIFIVNTLRQRLDLVIPTLQVRSAT